MKKSANFEFGAVKNDYLIAKFGVDTAENEPYKIWPACLLQSPALVQMNSCANAQVFPDGLVHADLRLLQVRIREDDADGVLALLTLQEHVISTEELELVHLPGRERHNAVVVVHGLLDDLCLS